MEFEIFTFSDKGPRSNNQDFLATEFAEKMFVACIADGVGGSRCGDLASSESVSEFVASISHQNLDLRDVFVRITDRLRETEAKNASCRGMATTLTGYYIANNILHGLHVGDSRLYLIRNNQVEQLSEDHTEVNMLVKSGLLTIEEAKTYSRRHVLQNAFTADRTSTDCQIIETGIQKGDRIILTTDGIHDIINNAELSDLSNSSGSIGSFGDAVIKTLTSRKITDNYSLIAVMVK